LSPQHRHRRCHRQPLHLQTTSRQINNWAILQIVVYSSTTFFTVFSFITFPRNLPYLSSQ
jgi:hypothetical protein